MHPREAIDQLCPEHWAATTIVDRLHLLEQLRSNLKKFCDELARSDASMKNQLLGEGVYGFEESRVATIVPVANTISAVITS